jgi:hypothetical protein
MFIAYLDASGRPDLAERENYVLASLVINERNWQIIDNAMKEIKLKHFPNLSDADIELHSIQNVMIRYTTTITCYYKIKALTSKGQRSRTKTI